MDTTAFVSAKDCVELLDHMGSDARVVNAARVSHAKWIDESKPLNDADKKLLSYLASHDHVTPSFHPQICLRITMPLFVKREWDRSVVGVARNEESRRYIDSPVKCFVPEVFRAHSDNIKQGSSNAPVTDQTMCSILMRVSLNHSMMTYRQLLGHGVCREQARMVLPQAMFTTFIETGSLAYYKRIIKLRNSPEAQYEIRQYAQAVADIVQKLFPNSFIF